MALKVVTMADLRLEVLLEVERTGLTVTEVCRRYGISRQTYYRYRRRYLAEGLDGLEDRSRRPLHPANQIPVDLEVRICEMRKDHPRWGARRIRTELTRAGFDAPAISTTHQVLIRNGLVAVEPPRRTRPISASSGTLRTTCCRSTPPGSCWLTTPRRGLLT